MNARRLILGALISLFLVGSACTANTSDEELYEYGVRKSDITKPKTSSVKKSDITKPGSRKK